MIFKEKSRPLPKREILRVEREIENLVELNLELTDPVQESIELVDYIEDAPEIELKSEDLELIMDCDDKDLEISIEDTENALYSIAYHKSGDPVGKIRNGEFHSMFINHFIRTLKSSGIEPLIIRRKSDNKVVLDASAPRRK